MTRSLNVSVKMRFTLYSGIISHLVLLESTEKRIKIKSNRNNFVSERPDMFSFEARLIESCAYTKKNLGTKLLTAWSVRITKYDGENSDRHVC